jgi:ribonuclease-3
MSLNLDIIKSLEKSAGYTFIDRTLAERALSHTSYAHSTGSGRQASNERLEYLGDALLKAYVARHLFLSFPEDEEGALSRKSAKALSGKALAKAAKNMGLNLIMLLSPQEEATGGRQKARSLAGCFEALTAAVFLDGGQLAMETFLLEKLEPSIEEELTNSERDPKSALQELLQGAGHALPEYVLKERSGPDHAPSFLVEVFDVDKQIGIGVGKSIKEAEQAAATDAAKVIKEVFNKVPTKSE